MILMISYDLDGHERPSAYTAVKNYIERNARSSIRPLYSQWFVDTSATAANWAAAFNENGLIDGNDRLFVCPITRPYQGLLSTADWNWLNARM